MTKSHNYPNFKYESLDFVKPSDPTINKLRYLYLHWIDFTYDILEFAKFGNYDDLAAAVIELDALEQLGIFELNKEEAAKLFAYIETLENDDLNSFDDDETEQFENWFNDLAILSESLDDYIKYGGLEPQE